MEEDQNNQEPEVIDSTPKTEKKGFNIASMILGIIALLGTCVWYINFPCSILAIIFSVIGRNNAGRGMGIAGMVLGIIAIVLYLIIIVLGILGISYLLGSGALNDLNTSMY